MLQKFKTFIVLFVSTISLVLAQEKGKIAGKVEDSGTSEELIGVAVGIKGTSQGSVTDIEGHYMLSLEPGTYTLIVNYVGYKTKEITDVVVVAGQTTDLKVTLEEATVETEEVVVTATFKKESVDALMLERKNSVAVSDGVSADLIKKTPDRNTADIIKRVSGATIQDNKFAIIRGLNERYNTAFINNSPLPSSEPDRKAFAFDIFPSNMVESMSIFKTATPDLPGDFAGGVIKIKTRDIPDENFTSVSIGLRTNNISTFKSGLGYQGGKTDWLGVDDGTRTKPSDFPTKDQLTTNYTQTGLSDSQKDEIQYQTFLNAAKGAKQLTNNWNVNKIGSLNPGTNIQVSLGRKIRNNFAVIGSVSYLRNIRNIEGGYREVNDSRVKESDYKDSQTNDEVLTGGLLNLSYKLRENHKFSFKNTFNINTTDQAFIRSGSDFVSSGNKFNIYSTNYIQNIFRSHQLSGDHFVTTGKFKIDWTIGNSNIDRTVPDYKILSYAKGINDPDSVKYRANTQGDPKNSGRFSSKMKEDINSFSLDVSKPLPTFWVIKSDIKIGTFIQERNRTFNTRQLVYKTFPNGFNTKYPLNSTQRDSIETLGPDKIFDNNNLDFEYNPDVPPGPNFVQGYAPDDFLQENLGWVNTQTNEFVAKKPKYSGTYTIEDLSDKQNQYNAGSSLRALYFMFDHKIWTKFRLTWGLRHERFNQRLNSEIPKESRIIALNTIKDDFLPSVNFTYSPLKNLNIRTAFSKTLNRPEYRELAPFSFYDLNSNRTIQGFDSLRRATINNYDIRAEFFPGAGQVVSLTYFHKTFIDPIERYQRPDGGSIFIEYDNAKSAVVRGWEIDFRQNLQIFSPSNKYLKRITLMGNFSSILSNAVPNAKKAKFSSERPLQGQSNYILNSGINYDNEEDGFSFSFMLNRVGRRIAYVGNTDEPDIWENPRTILDMQFVKLFLKKRLEAKVNISDLLGQRLYFYQDQDKNGKYNAEYDNYVFSYLYGTNITYSITYKF